MATSSKRASIEANNKFVANSVWIYVATFFAVVAALVAITVWHFAPQHMETTKLAFTILVSACIGAGLGSRVSVTSSEPSEKIRSQYIKRSKKQSGKIDNIFKAPIVWGAYLQP